MTAIDNSFVSAARDEFKAATEKEDKISKVRAELNPEDNKIMAVAFLAVVGKSMGLDNIKFKGRKAVVAEFRDVAASIGLKKAASKLARETALKMTRHAAFGNAIEAAADHGNVGDFAQEIGSIFAAEEIKTASGLRKFLNPEAEVSVVDALAITILKEVGAKKADIDISKKRIATGTVLDDEAIQLALDVIARIDPRAADVRDTLVDALNRQGVADIEQRVRDAA